MKKKQVALVYDWVDKWGGVERLLLALHTMFPEAPLYTSLYSQQTASWARNFDVRTSYMQKLPSVITRNRKLSLPFFPRAFEFFDFSGYDTVISVSSAFAKGVVTKPGTQHVGIILTPTRYIWGQSQQYQKSSFMTLLAGSDLRTWDYVAAQRPDTLVAISKAVQSRISKYYRRDSQVIYPPFDRAYWNKVTETRPKTVPAEYYLIVSRLELYKNIEYVIEAFRSMPNKHLVIVGIGSQLSKLRALAPENVHFTGEIDESELVYWYKHAHGLIMPQEEDFGYVSLEAQHFGCPVIAFRAGGALETVLEGKTGMFYDGHSALNIQNAVEKFHTVSYNYKNNLKTIGQDLLSKFDIQSFINNLSTIINI